MVVKLARCYAACELNEPQLTEPDHVGFWPLVTLSDEQRHHFETVEGELAGWPEVGSRALQRVEMLDGMPMVGSWLIDLLDDEEAMGYVQSLGYRQAPVVVTDEGQHWSGFSRSGSPR